MVYQTQCHLLFVLDEPAMKSLGNQDQSTHETVLVEAKSTHSNLFLNEFSLSKSKSGQEEDDALT